MQKRVARRLGAWDIEDDQSSSPGGLLRPHPIVSADCLDESDTESIRKMPNSHFIDDVNSSYADSVCGSVRSHTRGPSLTVLPTSKRYSMKSIGTDPIDEDNSQGCSSKKVEMVDRGCSPLPTECFDSDLDSEERLQCAIELWHMRPTVGPGMETELLKEQQLYIQHAQKQWKNRLQMTGKKQKWKKDPFRMDDVQHPIPLTLCSTMLSVFLGDPIAT